MDIKRITYIAVTVSPLEASKLGRIIRGYDVDDILANMFLDIANEQTKSVTVMLTPEQAATMSQALRYFASIQDDIFHFITEL